ncbi:CobQ/CobB/MinD/ParA nucleotide binding domain protein [compost metagenome]
MGRAVVIAVYSTVGGCGKTTVALNLVRQLATEGRNIFYLNLETIRSALVDGTENGRQDRKGLAELLYDLKAVKDRNESLQLPVSAYAFRDTTLQADTFDLPDNLDEMLEMEGEDTKELIDYIVNSGKYDGVIVDVDSCPNARTNRVLEHADRVVWLVTDNKDVMRKTECWLHYLERTISGEFSTLMGKTRFVVNRYSGTIPMGTHRKGMQLELTLPFIPAWNQGARKESLIHSAIYQQDVMKLCRDLYGDNNG